MLVCVLACLLACCLFVCFVWTHAMAPAIASEPKKNRRHCLFVFVLSTDYSIVCGFIISPQFFYNLDLCLCSKPTQPPYWFVSVEVLCSGNCLERGLPRFSVAREMKNLGQCNLVCIVVVWMLFREISVVFGSGTLDLRKNWKTMEISRQKNHRDRE